MEPSQLGSWHTYEGSKQRVGEGQATKESDREILSTDT